MRSASRTPTSSAACVWPVAWPAILTAIVLSAVHALGAAAPLLYTAATVFTKEPLGLYKPVMALPTHLYFVTSEIGATPYAFGTALVLALAGARDRRRSRSSRGAARRSNDMNMTIARLPLAIVAPAPRCSALEARDLTVAYGGVARVRNATAAFPRNRVTAILGPSGCGKSTLLRALNRTLELIPGARVESGRVLLDRLDIYGPDVSPSWVRTHVGMLQQRPAPFPMSIADNVLFGARYHGYVRDRAADVAPLPRARRAVGRGARPAATRPAVQPVGRAAAAAVSRAHARGAPVDRADGRAVQRARSARDRA